MSVRSARRDRALAIGIAAAMVGVLLPLTASTPAEADDLTRPGYRIEVLSGRPDSVTGGDALVEVRVPTDVDLDDVTVSLDGADVDAHFRPVDDHALRGLVDGLALGENLLEVHTDGVDGVRSALTLVNHPDTGPVFSGPHIPMYCTADSHWGLGEVDDDCHVESPTVTYRYRTTGGQWANLPAGSLPSDVAVTETSAGDEVPYVVRIERGTINRAVYETAILHAPGTDQPDPWTDTDGWNGRLVYTFGGACGIGHNQGTSTGGIENDVLLSRGYAVASSTLNVFANNCDDVTSAETTMMVKEHFAETYGAPDFTLGWGGSAGTMQQLLIANAYPGILDGVLGSGGYPDERSTTVTGHECRFILGSGDWDQEQGRAITGFATWGGGFHTCTGYTFFDGVDYPQQCPGHIPAEDRYHPTDNPDGIRCAIADQVANVYGTDPETGFGRPIIPDTVGVQYGLQALEDGVLTEEEFVELNENIGGLDVQGERTAERTSVDPDALEAAYASGRINQFDHGATWTPMIEVRGYSDLGGDFHDRFRSWTMHERLEQATGQSENFISVTSQSGAALNQTQVWALETMDAWLTARAALAEAQPDLDEVELTRQTRPGDAVDHCITPDGGRIDAPLTLDPTAACNEFYPFHRNPRIAAGGPTTADVLKCEVTPLVREDHQGEFTDEQWARLQAVFPDGICDWSQPGVGQVPLEPMWGPAYPDATPDPDPEPEPDPSSPFPDLPVDNVHFDAILELVERGILVGRADGTFEPAANLTRGQMASMLARASGLDLGGSTDFPDVPAGYAHEGAIAALRGSGIVEGFTDGTFRPGAHVTRQQAAGMVARWLDLPDGPSDAFPDIAGSPHARAIGALAEIGVALGDEHGRFQPAANVRRDQAASFVYRALRWDEDR